MCHPNSSANKRVICRTEKTGSSKFIVGHGLAANINKDKWGDVR